jgi:hypothetical protein
MLDRHRSVYERAQSSLIARESHSIRARWAPPPLSAAVCLLPAMVLRRRPACRRSLPSSSVVVRPSYAAAILRHAPSVFAAVVAVVLSEDGAG